MRHKLGKNLSPDEVRSSIARKLGLDVAGLPEPGRNVEGVVEMRVNERAFACKQLIAG